MKRGDPGSQEDAMSELRRMEIVPQVRRLLTQCAAVRPAERVLIVTDSGFEMEVVETFACVATEMGAEVVWTVMTPRANPGADPPAAVAQAMKGSDLVLELTSQWVGSSQARVQACAGGCRYLSMPELYFHLLRQGGPADVDFLKIRPTAETIRDKFEKADAVLFASPAGTNLRASLKGRKGRCLSGIADKPGMFSAPPIIESGTSPLEGTAEGTLVIDGVIPMVGIGQIRAPFAMEISGGRIRKFQAEGAGRQFADQFREVLERYQDPSMFEVAEMSVGLNPQSRMSDSAVDAEAKLGTAHVAFGDNRGYGGTNAAPGHIDCVFRDATIELDGERIFENGRLLIGQII